MASNLAKKATTTRAVAVAAAVGDDDDDGRIHPEGREVAWMDAELLLLLFFGRVEPFLHLARSVSLSFFRGLRLIWCEGEDSPKPMKKHP